MIVLGIDPGHTGALAFIDTVAHTVSIVDMPVLVKKGATKTRREVAAPLLARYVRNCHPDEAYLEEVWSSKNQQSVNAFTFGDGFGTIKGVLAMGEVPLHLVRPQVWKATMRAPKDKNEARARAVQLFPSCSDLFARVKDDGRAEAALIALYGALDQQCRFVRPLRLVEHPQ